MKFRPCIDIHNGKVKQIVGGSLNDAGNAACENFASEYDSTFYARMYREDGLKGGHIILLNPASSEYYEDTKQQAMSALRAYPQGMQIGGGITAGNAGEYIRAGASHVIVTSYVFCDGGIRWDNLMKLEDAVGSERVVIDLSCRRRDGAYYVTTNRWQTFTDVLVEESLLGELARHCDEFLIHGVDVEGKASGIEEGLVKILAGYEGIPVTYAGGIGTLEDLAHFRDISGGKIDFTIGSALDLFGGRIPYQAVKDMNVSHI